jgi:uncharacterized protein DUF4145
MPNLSPQLSLGRCPHCSVATPNLQMIHQAESRDHEGSNHRRWRIYCCGNCGGLVTASAPNFNQPTLDIFPASTEVSEDIPERAKSFLEQAVASIHAPAGAVMLAASSVDAMLKEKEYRTGSLYHRIEQAVQDNLLTTEMADWAHEVRLDANDQRHADEEATLPNENDAQKVIDFTTAIAGYLFVLPARIQQGLDG